MDVGAYGVATTGRWGDVAGESVYGWWSDPDTQVDFHDITATVDRFRSLPGAPSVERCDLVPEVPDGVVDFIDIAAIVDKFKDSVGAPAKARTDLAGDTPDLKIDFVDILYEVEAFKGEAYPFGGPVPCE